MTSPQHDADRHAAYYARLCSLDITQADALAMTVAYVQADALRLIAEPDQQPTKPTRVR